MRKRLFAYLLLVLLFATVVVTYTPAVVYAAMPEEGAISASNAETPATEPQEESVFEHTESYVTPIATIAAAIMVMVCIAIYVCNPVGSQIVLNDNLKGPLGMMVVVIIALGILIAI